MEQRVRVRMTRTASGCRSRRPSSTVAPAYIVITRSHRNSTTARSCETRMRPIPSSSRSWRMSTRISYWTVTSRAVVGSSRTSSGGLRARAAAIITRWRIPPDSWCERSWRTASARGIFTRSSSRRASARASLFDSFRLPEMERLEQLGLDGEDRVEARQRALRDIPDGPAADRSPVLLVGVASGRGRRSSAGRPVIVDAVPRRGSR